jgi:hypothetical protein
MAEPFNLVVMRQEGSKQISGTIGTAPEKAGTALRAAPRSRVRFCDC